MRIVEPYDAVELMHVSRETRMSEEQVKKIVASLILDREVQGYFAVESTEFE